MTEAVAQTPKLIVKYQGQVLKECVMSRDQFTIGRKPDNDLVIDDAAASGRHAKIVKIQAVYFIEDLQSTNGTLVNGNRVDRKQLRDADVVTIGKHRLVFLEEGKSAAAILPPAAAGSDKTIVIRSGDYGIPARVKPKIGILLVLSGRTDRQEYRLTRQLTIIGSKSDASVKLTGFFAPKAAAMIGRRGEGYYLSVPERNKKVHLNDLLVQGEADLQDGDLLEIAGVKMHFSLKDAAGTP